MKPEYKFFAIIGSILALTPIIIYVWHFSSFGISSDPQHWGVLGDYIGGILNPIISLASLCVLGYLTHLVSVQTSRDNKSLFILERRMLAYDELAKYVNPINSFIPRMNSAMAMMGVYQKLPPEKAAENVIKIYEELKSLSLVFTELHFTLFEFNSRYGHLFRYDFNSNEYKTLLTESKRVSQMMANLVTDYKAIAVMPDDERSLKKLGELLLPVFISLREEVETKHE